MTEQLLTEGTLTGQAGGAAGVANDPRQDPKDVDVESLGEEHINLVFALSSEDFGVDVNLVREIVRVP